MDQARHRHECCRGWLGTTRSGSNGETFELRGAAFGTSRSHSELDKMTPQPWPVSFHAERPAFPAPLSAPSKFAFMCESARAIGLGRSLTAPPSHTTGHTGHISGGSLNNGCSHAARADATPAAPFVETISRAASVARTERSALGSPRLATGPGPFQEHRDHRSPKSPLFGTHAQSFGSMPRLT